LLPWAQHRRWTLLPFVIILLCLGHYVPAAGQPPQTAAPTERLSPKKWAALEKSLRGTLAEQQQKFLDAKTRLVQEKDAQIDIRRGLEDLTSAVSAHQAALAVGSLPLAKTMELLEEFRQRREKLMPLIKQREEELTALTRSQGAAAAALAEMQPQVELLRTSKGAVPSADRLLTLSQRYRKTADAYQQQLVKTQEAMTQSLDDLRRQRNLLEEMTATLETYRDKTFKDSLLKRQEGGSLTEDLRSLMEESGRLPGRVYAWANHLITSGALSAFVRGQAAPLSGLVLFLALLLIVARYLRRLLKQYLLPWSERAVSFSWKTLLALARVVLRNLALLFLTLWVGLSLRVLKLWDNKAAIILFYGLAAWTALRLAQALCQAVFDPRHPGGGIVRVDVATARFYRRHLNLFLVFFFLSNFALEALQQLQYPGNVLLVAHFLYLMGVLGWIAWLLRKPYLENLLEGMGLSPSSRRGSFMRALRPLVLLLLGVVIITHLLGFQYFALYLTNAAAQTTLVAIGFWLLSQMAVDFNDYLNKPETGVLARQLALPPATLQRTHTHFPKVIHALLLVGFLLTTAMFWGVEFRWLQMFFTALDQGLHLGSIKLSPLSLFLAVGSILLLRRLARFANFILAQRVYERRGWDVGIQHTISTTITYSCITLGIILAMGFLGLNLTNLALVAGALGVGIGFGLQNIVNNFISGLILLFERPIKVGDMLVIDGQWGLVKTIRVRSTVFETFDRYVMIIPNSDLISNKVINWTHYGRGPTRLTLKVGVAYGSNVHTVTQTIEQVCRANKRVLPEPPPQVFFQAYGDSSLDFNIWVHVRRPDDRVPATHELNTAIYEAFKVAGIEIPFPQRDLHIRTMPPWPPAPGADPSS